jgi:hypothetical protein
MKNLDWQLSNLELSKRLCELGVKQESLFYHVDYQGYNSEIVTKEKRVGSGGVSAFTVAELGEKVLKNSNIEWKLFFILRGENAGKVMIYSAKTPGYHNPNLPTFMADTLANMLAEMLIYLIENGLITL